MAWKRSRAARAALESTGLFPLLALLSLTCAPHGQGMAPPQRVYCFARDPLGLGVLAMDLLHRQLDMDRTARVSALCCVLLLPPHLGCAGFAALLVHQ